MIGLRNYSSEDRLEFGLTQLVKARFHLYVTFWPIVFFLSFCLRFKIFCARLCLSLFLYMALPIYLCACVYVFVSIFHSLAPSPPLLKSRVYMRVSLVNLTVFFLSYFYRVFNFHLFLWVIYCRVDDSTIAVSTRTVFVLLLAFSSMCCSFVLNLIARARTDPNEHSWKENTKTGFGSVCFLPLSLCQPFARSLSFVLHFFRVYLSLPLSSIFLCFGLRCRLIFVHLSNEMHAQQRYFRR